MIIHILQNDQIPAGIARNLRLESRMFARIFGALVDGWDLEELYVHLALCHVAMVADMLLSSAEGRLVRESREGVIGFRVFPLSTLFF
jgi:hypothetical protein